MVASVFPNGRRPVLSVIGLGKLGAPMAAVFAAKGFEVIGVDLNKDFVEALNQGRAPVVEPQLQELIDSAKLRMRATLDFSDAVQNSDVTFIIVPTPSEADRRFSNKYLISALESIGAALTDKGGYHVVVVTSTTMPGSCESELKTTLERASGRKVGEQLGLCYNPEFIALGSVVHDMLYPDMILIGQSDDKAGLALMDVYAASTESKPEFHRMNLVSAELAKISVNTYVTTKISYANMIADMCDHLPGADADVVTRAVGADSRIGRKYLKPAIGYGGPCFPRDNKAFAALARQLGVNCDLAEATDSINEHQFNRLLGAVDAVAEQGAKVTILGMSYKPNTHVIEESQGVALAQRLVKEGYDVTISDPQALPAAQAVLQSSVKTEIDPARAVDTADVVIIMTPWDAFKAIPVERFVRLGSPRAIVDPWSIFDREVLGKVAKVIRLGTGGWKTGTSSREQAA